MAESKQNMQTKYGYSPDIWEKAKTEMREILSEYAKSRATIFYSELVSKIKTIRHEPDSYALAHMLGEISEAENAKGRGMLSALVVQKDGGMPGRGFFEFAQELGYPVKDKTEFWIDQVNTVCAYWENQK